MVQPRRSPRLLPIAQPGWLLQLPVELIICIMGWLVEAETPQAVRTAHALGIDLPSPFRHLVAARSTCKLLREAIFGVTATTAPLRGVPHGLWLSDTMILSTAAKSNYRKRMAQRALAKVKCMDVATVKPIQEQALTELLRGSHQLRALTLHDASRLSGDYLNGGGFHALTANLGELRLCGVGAVSYRSLRCLDFAGLVVACPHLTVLALERVKLSELLADDAPARSGGDDGETRKVAALKSLELITIEPPGSVARLLNAQDGPVASSLQTVEHLRTNMLDDGAFQPEANTMPLRKLLQRLKCADLSGCRCSLDCNWPPLAAAETIRVHWTDPDAVVKLITPPPKNLRQWCSIGTPSSKRLVEQLAKCKHLVRGCISSHAIGRNSVNSMLREFFRNTRFKPPTNGRMAYSWNAAVSSI